MHSLPYLSWFAFQDLNKMISISVAAFLYVSHEKSVYHIYLTWIAVCIDDKSAFISVMDLHTGQQTISCKMMTLWPDKCLHYQVSIDSNQYMGYGMLFTEILSPEHCFCALVLITFRLMITLNLWYPHPLPDWFSFCFVGQCAFCLMHISG